MAKVNDIVRFLNEVGGGRITRIDGKIAYVEDDDGFDRPVPINECVVVAPAKLTSEAYNRPLSSDMPEKFDPEREKKAKAAATNIEQPAEKPLPPAVETEEGEKLNVVLAYEANELKHLNTTSFFAYLVNDSNYYLYFTYLSRDDESADGLWITRFHGVVEPNTQVQLEEFSHDALPNLSRVAIQYVAFKQGKNFKLKNPALVEQRLDVTKFYKLHCFRENEYFDEPVIALDIVRNDCPAHMITVNSADLERAMREKKAADHPAKRPVEKHTKVKDDIIECDLHINSLLDTTSGLSNSDMLNYQLDKFREVMNANIKHIGAKIVFIHGKGEGVLRNALLSDLRKRYPRCTAQDASFREYGFGATLVTIH
jgi:hypothetical protein